MTREAWRSCDVVVVGAGIAGLYTALEIATWGQVIVVASGAQTSSQRAQGGIAAATAPDDSPQLHADDTWLAARGLGRRAAITALTTEGPDCIRKLRDYGVRFDANLGREGGHSRRRIHSVEGSRTGSAVWESLLARARSHRAITWQVGSEVRSLWRNDGRCIGVQVGPGLILARAVVLATGGYAGLWKRTTNPRSSRGDGLHLAYGIGAALADLEFVQFHPTVLANGVLLSEALRGAGAVLRDQRGERFVDELAGRDEVSRAIAQRDGAFLDLRAIDREGFPLLMEEIAKLGLDPSRDLVPVTPAAHYTMGGIKVDLHGRSTIPGLFAVGECACTGVHGANRLASNSLLECLVFGARVAQAASAEPPAHAGPPPTETTLPVVRDSVAESLWRDAGLSRCASDLARLTTSPFPLAGLIALAAKEREESRGAHYRADYPHARADLDGLHLVFTRGDLGSPDAADEQRTGHAELRWELWQ